MGEPDAELLPVHVGTGVRLAEREGLALGGEGEGDWVAGVWVVWVGEGRDGVRVEVGDRVSTSLADRLQDSLRVAVALRLSDGERDDVRLGIDAE